MVPCIISQPKTQVTHGMNDLRMNESLDSEVMFTDRETKRCEGSDRIDQPEMFWAKHIGKPKSKTTA